jgi:hypothetical protein
MAAAESSPIASPTWFSRLFFRAMAQHSQTSRALRCTRAGSVLGEHNAHFVSLLHNLSSLEMSINAGAVRRVDPPTEWVDADGVHHHLVSVGISVEVEQADVDPVVVCCSSSRVAVLTR